MRAGTDELGNSIRRQTNYLAVGGQLSLRIFRKCKHCRGNEERQIEFPQYHDSERGWRRGPRGRRASSLARGQVTYRRCSLSSPSAQPPRCAVLRSPSGRGLAPRGGLSWHGGDRQESRSAAAVSSLSLPRLSPHRPGGLRMHRAAQATLSPSKRLRAPCRRAATSAPPTVARPLSSCPRSCFIKSRPCDTRPCENQARKLCATPATLG